MIKNYVQSLTIKGLLGAGTVGIMLPYLLGFFFSSFDRRMSARCESLKLEEAEQSRITSCELNLEDLRALEFGINSLLAALGISGCAAGTMGRIRASGPLGKVKEAQDQLGALTQQVAKVAAAQDKNGNGIPDHLENINKKLDGLMPKATTVTQRFHDGRPDVVLDVSSDDDMGITPRDPNGNPVDPAKMIDGSTNDVDWENF